MTQEIRKSDLRSLWLCNSLFMRLEKNSGDSVKTEFRIDSIDNKIFFNLRLT